MAEQIPDVAYAPSRPLVDQPWNIPVAWIVMETATPFLENARLQV
jgi:hypothetical protein